MNPTMTIFQYGLQKIMVGDTINIMDQNINNIIMDPMHIRVIQSQKAILSDELTMSQIYDVTVAGNLILGYT